MELILLSLGLLLISGLVSALLRSDRLALAGALAACLAGLAGSLPAALGAPARTLDLPWAVPLGSFSLALDPLAGWFLVPTFLVTGLCALYGKGHLEGRKPGSWLAFHLLAASLALVFLARNGVLFLVAWEGMSLTSYFLVTLDDDKESARQAGWIYLVATHLGTAFLLVLFILLGGGAPDLDFPAPGSLSGPLAGVCFLLALVGFGTKAGFLPLHVWLPEAHPAAPSHVSALMSGVMIKAGIYGLARILPVLGPPPAWWGWTLLVVGATSGVMGVLFALAQHDLKRLLAYHSVENIGIIALGMGLGLLGQAQGNPALAALGMGGALLHVLNHALFKSLLFLGAGSVIHATGTADIEELGGLVHRMPRTALTFLVGSVAICGLPPLNGFASEFLIFLGSFSALKGPAALAGLTALASLALISGLAVACFTKAFGIVFTGEPRSEHARHGHDPVPAMTGPMLVLAALCLTLGLGIPLAAAALLAPLAAMGLAFAPTLEGLAPSPLGVTLGSGGFLALALGLAAWRRTLLAGRSVSRAPTWDCGYLQPTARMQYTASSFAHPLTQLFSILLPVRGRRPRLEEVFPGPASLATVTPDSLQERVYRPAFEAIARLLGRLRWLQHGRLPLYVLYIMLTLIGLFAWGLSR
jgi:hydrogenase-4 component B